MRIPVAVLLAASTAFAAPQIFPRPKHVEPGTGSFLLDASVCIVTPPGATPEDRSLAALIAADLTDRFQLAVKTVPAGSVARGQRYIAVGELRNPWIRSRGAARAESDAAEGYALSIQPERIVIAGRDAPGSFYGAQTLRQLLGPAGTRIDAMAVDDAPASPFRGIKMYLPGRENIGFFKRFVRDFMAPYKFNKLILELNAGMRLDRHPEINAGWLELGRDLFGTRRERPSGPHGESQDSVHHDTADGGILEKAEVADLANWARLHQIEVIPELPSMTHSYYLLARHRELAEIPEAEWPDTWCPSLPQSYELFFDVLDEYIEVLKPATIHIGHDEWRIPWGSCPRCRGKDPREIFASDVNKIYEHLKAKGVKTAIWGDHLIEPLRGVRVEPKKTRSGYAYQTPGGLSPEQVQALIPKDILIFNWFWDDRRAGQGEVNDDRLAKWGFQQVYGNMTLGIQNYARRSARAGVLGGAPSSWAATTALNFGKDLMGEFLGCASMLWARESLDPAELGAALGRELPRLRTIFTGATPWSDFSSAMLPVELPAPSPDGEMPRVVSGPVRSGKLQFKVGTLLRSSTSLAIPINQDASSLVFLQATEKRGISTMAYRIPHDAADTADLAGWYEVVYEDGFVATVPVRTGVNILAWDSPKGASTSAYDAIPMDIGGSGTSATFYAFEWPNPRLGKVIREVRVKGAAAFERADGRKVANSIVLAAISYVPKKSGPPAGGPPIE